MKTKRILLIQGHPDASEPRLCHALALSFATGAEEAGRIVRLVNVAGLDFPLQRSQKDFQADTVRASLKPVQEDILCAEHLVIFFPLWAGDMPALLKGFLEQLMRPSFSGEHASFFDKKALSGCSARVVVTMDMPAFIYRWYVLWVWQALASHLAFFTAIYPLASVFAGVIIAGAAAIQCCSCEEPTHFQSRISGRS